MNLENKLEVDSPDMQAERNYELEYEAGKILKVYVDEETGKWYIDISTAYALGLIEYDQFNKYSITEYQEQFNEWLNSECSKNAMKHTNLTSGQYAKASISILYEDFVKMFTQLYPVSKELVRNLEQRGYIIVYVMAQPELKDSNPFANDKDTIINDYINMQKNNLSGFETEYDDLNKGFQR